MGEWERKRWKSYERRGKMGRKERMEGGEEWEVRMGEREEWSKREEWE